MRYLWLAFLIGWSGSTYAAVGTSPSVDVPITISSSGPTPPPGAVAAGFTTLAANYDFTQPLPANWLGCSPYDSNAHQWYQGIWWANPQPPCNINQVSDTVAGSNVLDMTWLPSYGTAGGYGGAQAIATMSPDTTKVTDFPNAYYEIVYRVTPTVANSYTGFYTWSQAAAKGGSGPIEWDHIETYGTAVNGYDAAIHNWGNNNIGSNFIWQTTSKLPAGYDPTKYHTYAGRITSDGSTMSICSYVDNVFIACQNPQAVGAEFNQRNFLVAQIGQNNGSTPQQTDMFVKSIRVWSCANWQTSMCNGTVLTGAP
jgi:hypothetical protein